MLTSAPEGTATRPAPLPDPASAALPRFARNELGRDFAVGDIHGCFSELERALAAIGFDPLADRLFSVGDLVDRGPESHQVLHWLDKPWFHAICGNHELMTWRAALGLPYPDVDHAENGGEWLAFRPEAEQKRIGRRLAALPLAMEVETTLGMVGLVHADCPFDDWERMRAVQWDQVDPVGPLADSCLWSIERYMVQDENEVQNVRAVVHGHVRIPRMAVLGNTFFIDTGGWCPGGRFTFLELETLTPFLGDPVATQIK